MAKHSEWVTAMAASPAYVFNIMVGGAAYACCYCFSSNLGRAGSKCPLASLCAASKTIPAAKTTFGTRPLSDEAMMIKGIFKLGANGSLQNKRHSCLA